MLESLSSELRIGYFDDTSLGGDRQALLHDLQSVISEGKRIGLLLNFSKCEVVNSACVEGLVEFADFERVDSKSVCLLGTPLTNGPAMDKALTDRCNDLARGIDRLKLLAAHDALVILKASLSTSKLLHIMRSSPCADHDGLVSFDSLLRTGLSSILNIVISDVNWIQASLPACVRWGLGDP